MNCLFVVHQLNQTANSYHKQNAVDKKGNAIFYFFYYVIDMPLFVFEPNTNKQVKYKGGMTNKEIKKLQFFFSTQSWTISRVEIASDKCVAEPSKNCFNKP